MRKVREIKRIGTIVLALTVLMGITACSRTDSGTDSTAMAESSEASTVTNEETPTEDALTGAEEETTFETIEVTIEEPVEITVETQPEATSEELTDGEDASENTTAATTSATTTAAESTTAQTNTTAAASSQADATTGATEATNADGYAIGELLSWSYKDGKVNIYPKKWSGPVYNLDFQSGTVKFQDATEPGTVLDSAWWDGYVLYSVVHCTRWPTKTRYAVDLSEYAADVDHWLGREETTEAADTIASWNINYATDSSYYEVEFTTAKGYCYIIDLVSGELKTGAISFWTGTDKTGADIYKDYQSESGAKIKNLSVDRSTGEVKFKARCDASSEYTTYTIKHSDFKF